MGKTRFGIVVSAIFFAFLTKSFAGDAAAFVDIGISQDGKTYIFGEYGKTDKKFQGYAEIYTVDIEKNNFVRGGVFKTEPSASTAVKSGKDVFFELKEKSSWWLKKYNCRPVSEESVLYFSDGLVSGDKEIVFKDTEGSTVEQSVFYHIRLVKNVEGKGADVSSSFFITLEKADENGHIMSRNIVGSPSIKRKNVTDYKIEKIFSDSRGRNLVFVVEKNVEDENGTSIRYMVETIHL